MSWQQAYENGKNGQSFWGQGYTSMLEGIAHADGQAARAEAEAAAKQASSSSWSQPSYSQPSYSSSTASVGSYSGSSYAGGGSSYSGGHASGGSEFLSGIFGLVFLAGLGFGVYDNAKNRADISHSIGMAAGGAYAVGDFAGTKIEGFGTHWAFTWAGTAVRWGITIPAGIVGGAGAGAGSIGTAIVKAVVGGVSSGRGSSRSGNPTATNRYATVSTINLNLRSGPGPDYPVVAVMPEGLRAKIVGNTESGWVELAEVTGNTGETYRGYANPKFLKED